MGDADDANGLVDAIDDFHQDVDDSGARMDVGDDSTCSHLPSACVKGKPCDNICGGQCVAWEYDTASRSLATDYVCIRSSTRFPSRCSANIVGSSFCGFDEVCSMFMRADGTFVQSVSPDCVDITMCVEYTRRFDREHPEAVARQACWYSDMTIARTGVRAPARCLWSGMQTCGVGCASCAVGTVCTWSSERYPTGFCMPIRPSNPFQHATCAAPNTVWPCGAGQACLQPLRGNADRFEDRRRGGLCITTEDCRAAAAAFPDGYQCTYRPW